MGILVMWLCRNTSSHVEAIFNPQKPQLSQLTVLSLIQQLGSTLTEETDMKMIWLQHALCALNVKDPMIVAHIGAILHQLNTNVAATQPLFMQANGPNIMHLKA